MDTKFLMIFIISITFTCISAKGTEQPSKKDVQLANQMICASMLVGMFSKVEETNRMKETVRVVAEQSLKNMEEMEKKSAKDRAIIEETKETIAKSQPVYLFGEREIHDNIRKHLEALNADSKNGTYSATQIEKERTPYHMKQVLRESVKGNKKFYGSCYRLIASGMRSCEGSGDELQQQVCAKKYLAKHKDKVKAMWSHVFPEPDGKAKTTRIKKKSDVAVTSN